MTYEQALDYLKSLTKFGMNFGLTRIQRLLELLHHPQRRFKIIHVAGTNGKGSTAAMLSAILQAAGIKTALYTSPHLLSYTERMMVNGRQITCEEFAAVLDHTRDAVNEMVKTGGEHPTEFEVLTAAAFHFFAMVGVEYAVVEAGLGGLLDSTNVVRPEVAVITNVTLEHTDICGKTVAEIARHKAGIIKQGIPVVTAAQGEAQKIIRETAAEKNAPLLILGEDFSAQQMSSNGCQQEILLSTSRQGCLGRFAVNLLGRHQVENSALAVMAAQIIANGESRITVAAIQLGLANVQWPGRFEVVHCQPITVLDGAHNPAGARVLRATLDEVFPGAITFLLGILADKDIAAITEALVRAVDDVVIVRPLSERAADPQVVASNLAAKRIEIATSISEGYAKACSLAGSAGVVCAAGSLYLIGPAREIIYNSLRTS
jgi:dihydrofolate synthase/folylpolyglutamate synthase